MTIYTSKCAQMYPQQLLNRSKFYSRCKKCDIDKTVGGGYHPPLGSLEVNIQTSTYYNERLFTYCKDLDNLHIYTDISLASFYIISFVYCRKKCNKTHYRCIAQ